MTAPLGLETMRPKRSVEETWTWSVAQGILVPTPTGPGSRAARYLAKHIPGARLYPFEGSGHLPLFTATRAFCEALRQFARTGTVPPGRDSTPRV